MTKMASQNAQKAMSKEGKLQRTQKNKARKAATLERRRIKQNKKMAAKREIREHKRDEIKKAQVAGTFKRDKVQRTEAGNILVTVPRKMHDAKGRLIVIDEFVRIDPCCEAKSFHKCPHHTSWTKEDLNGYRSPRTRFHLERDSRISAALV